ncbi:MAG TPA: Na+/H+ antiporter NhaA [Edaphocola sp.]|nr:Na+/H+ antiporter NhaA [Edaphocola sp.]
MQNKKALAYVVRPIQRFIQDEKSAGIVLGISVVIALILANSSLSVYYNDFLHSRFALSFNGSSFLDLDMQEWINDALMAVFFFVVGLELKREMLAGELAQPKKALLPIAAALGGMIVPATIYFLLNPTGEASRGWGIPMATDIAFALGVLYLLGKRVPLALKVFLTALAIVDDLGAVAVIAIFYTADISMIHLIIGLSGWVLLIILNKMSVRKVWVYVLIGIVAVWYPFLLSGVHATIAAVLIAFTIPLKMKVPEKEYSDKIYKLIERFRGLDPKSKKPVLTSEQLQVLEAVKDNTTKTMPPLQHLEHSLHSFVNFFVLPIFAIANAGIALNFDLESLFENHVALGVALGLIVGKVIGIVGFTLFFIKIGLSKFPTGMNLKSLFGISLIAGIGFTMSLFVTTLAFDHETLKVQAKVGVFVASILSGILGYIVLSRSSKKKAINNM